MHIADVVPFEHQYAALRLLREERRRAESADAGADDDVVERDVEEQANTRWSLDYYATRFRKSRSQPAKGESTFAATRVAKARTAGHARARRNDKGRTR